MTGRLIFHYHSRSQTGRSDMHREVPRSYAQINIQDGERLKIKDGELVRLKSRRGETDTIARLSDDVAPGVVYMTMHFADGVNNLTNTALDPLSKMPELKHCAIAIEKLGGN